MKLKLLFLSLLVIVTLGLSSFFGSNPSNKNDTVLWFDDFEDDTVKWLGNGWGSVTRSTSMAFNGEASLNITAYPWNTEEALKQIGAIAYPLPFLTLEFWFSCELSGYENFGFGLEYCSANREVWYRSGILFSGQYENGTGYWIDIEGWPLGFDLDDRYCIWHYAKLTVDLANGDYISLQIDDYEFDLFALGYKCCDRTKEHSPSFWGIIYPYFYSFGGYSSNSVLIDDVRLKA